MSARLRRRRFTVPSERYAMEVTMELAVNKSLDLKERDFFGLEVVLVVLDILV